MADARTDQDASSQELANTRTDWAEDRTMLANERTFAAWMRTGMACVALALGLKAVFGTTDYPWVAKIVAEIFILCGILIFWAAVRKCQKTQARMDAHDAQAQSVANMRIVACILTAGAMATGVILWLL
ncbi:DUF202 domain-containing protein [Yoonia sp. SS1-5]|uniref:YidH family protein n=1 Tax=Yoonia rhodophyticola TaxID=3137370 RepID=A0AAN0MDH3_9RHOB